jgi:hypothetical protein
LAAFTVPGKTVAPLIVQTPHCPSTQTCPPPHVVPLGSLLQAVVEVVGTHSWHGLAGFAVPAE